MTACQQHEETCRAFDWYVFSFPLECNSRPSSLPLFRTSDAHVRNNSGHFASHPNLSVLFDYGLYCRYGITIDGKTMNSTFFSWYTEGADAAGSSAIDGPWPSDKTCSYTKGKHGAC